MAEKTCYYEVLRLDRSASKAEIDRAYRKLAIKYHPDSNRDDETAVEKFKEATEAYEVLHDSEKRGRYDQFGHAGVNGPSGGPGGFHGDFDLSDALRAFMRDFGGGGGGRFVSLPPGQRRSVSDAAAGDGRRGSRGGGQG